MIAALTTFALGYAVAYAVQTWRTRCHEPRAVRLRLPGVTTTEAAALIEAREQAMRGVVRLPTAGPGVGRYG